MLLRIALSLNDHTYGFLAGSTMYRSLGFEPIETFYKANSRDVFLVLMRDVEARSLHDFQTKPLQ